MMILTLNLHCFAEKNISINQKKIVDAIIKEDIDVILLQEVAQSIDSKIVLDDIKEDNYALTLKKLLNEIGAMYDLHYKVGNKAFGIYDEGLAILSKTKLTSKTHFFISKTIDYENWSTRVIVSAKTLLDGKQITFTSVHLGWSDGIEVFENQVDNLLSNLKSNDINIIAGDFNISPNTKEYKYLTKKGYIDLFYNNDMQYFNIPTHASDIDQKDGSSRIDYIMSNAKFEVITRKILFNTDLVSDHFGVLLEVRMDV